MAGDEAPLLEGSVAAMVLRRGEAGHLGKLGIRAPPMALEVAEQPQVDSVQPKVAQACLLL